MRIASYGAGTQSTAMLVLAAQGRIDYQTFVFANVGEDSEHPASLAYFRDVAVPYAQAHGIELHELKRHRRDGSVETLYGRLTRGSDRSIGIPARLHPSGAPGRRNCTVDFKILVINRWLKKHGASAEEPATVALGISVDEMQRARSTSGLAEQVLDYPLLRLRLNRRDCVALIEEAGLPRPGKSSCWFCPYHSIAVWQKMRLEEPELFAKAVGLEALLSDRHQRLGRGPLHMTDRGKPLPMVTTDHTQGELFAATTADNCESGYCEVV